ncbi:copia protein [Tanacetum coccineum]
MVELMLIVGLNVLGIERGILSQKGSGGGRGVKEKNLNKEKSLNRNSMNTSSESFFQSNYASLLLRLVMPLVSLRMLILLVNNGNKVESERFANTAYGFFLGKKVAYPVVASYVRNTWGKYGLVRSMFSFSTRLFSFQFSSMDGLDVMLENGPWFIRNNSIILKKWHPDENLLKEDVNTVPVWVRLHSVPVTAFSEDGLSAVATKLGTPLILDSYTSDMCMQSWGWSSYARVMIELRADVELKDNIVVAMPKITREGHYTCNVRVEYEWKPPRCSSCKVFGHIHEECPKNTGKLRLLDNDGNSLVPTGIVESDSEVEVVFDETANLRISTSGKDGS